MQRQQGFIGCDHMLAVGNRAQNQFFGQGGATDEFNHNIDVRIIHYLPTVTHHAARTLDQRLRLGHIAYRDHLNVNSAARTPGNFGLIPTQYLESAGTDGAQAE